LTGGAGSDVLDAGEGNDTLSGGEGTDWLWGREGNDVMVGGGGTDRLEGGEGDDVVHGQAGNDTLIGGEGNDVLSGGLNRDLMIGGTGADRFVFNHGWDVVTDFEPGDDDLDLRMIPGLTSFGQLAARATQVGTDLVLSFGADRVTLQNLRLAQLDRDDVLL
jgi:Ca2+-binding RTX toxin-like protein